MLREPYISPISPSATVMMLQISTAADNEAREELDRNP